MAPLGPKKLGSLRSFLVRRGGNLRRYLVGPLSIEWGGVLGLGCGQARLGMEDADWRSTLPTGGARHVAVFRQIQLIKWELPNRFTSMYQRRCAGKLVDSNARWLGCFFPEDSQVRNLVFLMLLSQHRMDGHVFRYSQANSIGICACTLHALRNLLQHYTCVSSFRRVWWERKTVRTLMVLELKTFPNPGTDPAKNDQIEPTATLESVGSRGSSRQFETNHRTSRATA